MASCNFSTIFLLKLLPFTLLTDTSQNEPTPNPIGNKPTKQVDNSEVSVLNTLSSQGGDSTKQVSVLQPKHSKQHRLSLAHFCGKRPQVHFSHALTCHMAVEVCKADLSYPITSPEQIIENELYRLLNDEVSCKLLNLKSDMIENTHLLVDAAIKMIKMTTPD